MSGKKEKAKAVSNKQIRKYNFKWAKVLGWELERIKNDVDEIKKKIEMIEEWMQKHNKQADEKERKIEEIIKRLEKVENENPNRL